MKKSIIRVLALMLMSLTLMFMVSAADVNQETEIVISVENAGDNPAAVQGNVTVTRHCYYCLQTSTGYYYCSGLFDYEEDFTCWLTSSHGSGCKTHVYLWWIPVDVWQNQYNIVK